MWFDDKLFKSVETTHHKTEYLRGEGLLIDVFF